jgi:hypothetical protein
MAATTIAFPSPLELSAHTKIYDTIIYNADIEKDKYIEAYVI